MKVERHEAKIRRGPELKAFHMILYGFWMNIIRIIIIIIIIIITVSINILITIIIIMYPVTFISIKTGISMNGVITVIIVFI